MGRLEEYVAVDSIADYVVVGAGLFGSVIAATLRRSGAEVMLVDSALTGSGSRPAGCVIRPSWLSSMDREDLSESMRLLGELYDLRSISFEVWPVRKEVACHRIEPTEILERQLPVVGHVESVSPRAVRLASGSVLKARRAVIVATGVWAEALVPEIFGLVKPRWGWSHRGDAVSRPTIRPWAPYRQVVSFTMEDGRSWVGDGMALVARSATSERETQSRERCREIGGLAGSTRTLMGARPVATGQGPALVRHLQDGLWVATGGGKNGTAGAAWAALRIVFGEGLR